MKINRLALSVLAVVLTTPWPCHGTGIRHIAGTTGLRNLDRRRVAGIQRRRSSRTFNVRDIKTV